MAKILGRSEEMAEREGSARTWSFAALGRDVGGSFTALADALGGLDDLEETPRAIGEAYGGEGWLEPDARR